MKKMSLIIVIAAILLSLLMYPKTYISVWKFLHNAIAMVRLSTFSGADEAYQSGGQPTNKTRVVFMFDDGWESVYTAAYPLLENYGYKASVAVIPSKVGEYEYMSFAQLAELYMNGWDMLNHTYYHKEDLYDEPEDLLDEIIDAGNWLANHQFQKCKNMVVTAYGTCNPYLIKLLKDRGFESIRTSDNIISLKNDVKYLNASTVHMLTDVSAEAVVAQLFYRAKQNDIILLNLHKINSSTDPTQMSFSPEKLQRVLEFLSKSSDRFEVVPYSCLFE